MKKSEDKNTDDYKKHIMEMVDKIESQDFLMKIYYFIKAFIDE